MDRPAWSSTDHPVLLSALGLAPLLAPARTLLSASAMALFFTLVLLFCSLVTGCLRRWLPWRQQLVFLLLITTTVVACADRLLQLWLFELHAVLGLYLPVVAVNTLLLSSLEENTLDRPLRRSLPAVLVTAALVMVIIPVAGTLRELLGQGGLLTDRGQVLPEWGAGGAIQLMPGLPLFESAAGAFLILGLLLALLRQLSDRQAAAAQTGVGH